MKAQLKYPIFSFSPQNNVVYVCWEENTYTTTSIAWFKRNKREKNIVVDASGMMYIIKTAHFIRWKGIRGFIGMQRGIIEIENEYEENPIRITLRTLQEIVVKRYPKSQECRSGLWGNADEFTQAIFDCKTFEEVADILMPERKMSVWQRIEEYFLRAGFVMLAVMFLYHVVWRLIQKAWLWIVG